MQLSETRERLPVQENVVLAYPYDDALFSLFHESIVGTDGRVIRAKGKEIRYNRNLFHPEIKQLYGRAAAVACLFENIILAPRPLELPDIDTYTKGNNYIHPDLRLQMPAEAPPQFGKYVQWIDFGNDDGEMFSEFDHLDSMAMALSSRRPFQAFFKKHKKIFTQINPSFPNLAFSDLIYNTIEESFLARKYNAVLLGNDVFHELYRLIRTKAPAKMELFPEFDPKSVKAQRLDFADVDALSLMFAPTTIDAFAAVRMDKQIREYGKNWRRIISTAEPTELRASLLDEMAKAYQCGSVAGKASGMLSMIGTFLTWLGWLIPGSDFAGMGVDLLDKAAGKIEKQLGWRLIGARMQEVAQDANLAKHLSDKKARKHA